MVDFSRPLQTKGHTPPKVGTHLGVCSVTGMHRVAIVGDSPQSIRSEQIGEPILTTFLYRGDAKGKCRGDGAPSPFDLENA